MKRDERAASMNNANLEEAFDDQLTLFNAKDHYTFLTNKVDTDYHSHNFIQITIDLQAAFQVNVEEDSFVAEGIILSSNVSHKLYGCDHLQLYLLINPESIFGESIKAKFLQEKQVYRLSEAEIKQLLELNISAISAVRDAKEYGKFIKSLKEILEIQDGNLENKRDIRIQEILNCIETYPLDKLFVKELSSKVFLSESRLSHLFKEQIGISLTSYILNQKLEKAFDLIFKGSDITYAALEAGFSSSAHFAHSVRDKLGMASSIITKNSRYLQV